jgi:hypothetical protein
MSQEMTHVQAPSTLQLVPLLLLPSPLPLSPVHVLVMLCSLLLLLPLVLLRQAAGQHGMATPQVVIEHLPRICPSGLGFYQVQDVTDSTSYYICCGGDTPVVRKTCR